MPDIGMSAFSTFGDLLKYLRRRVQLTQRELAIAVGYTEGHISRLEKNLRPPDLATVAALFVPALGLEEEPEIAAQLLQLVAKTHGESLQAGENLTISRVQETTEISESTESIPSNLPIQLTTFIGRQAEIAEITELLSGTKPIRLLTLTGPGGIGKTRLALQTVIGLSHLYRDGIWFVDLAPLSSPELVPPTLASVLSVPEGRAQSLEETLIAHLRQKRILIVIDNCEHLIRATAQLAEKILRACAHVQLLATSRELLNIPGEVNFRVPPLSLPEEQDGASQTALVHEAVQLFIERARNLQYDFALTDANAGMIARICRQLDGMPLAIELAAARISLLSLSQIEARLKDRFQLLSGGQTTLPRHQTLRATIEWSHDLLSEAEKVLFRRLAVFAGGWTLEAVESVCRNGPTLTSSPAPLLSGEGSNTLTFREGWGLDPVVLDLLAGLINKSLVVVEGGPDAEVRYFMLETIREYAREQLRASGELESLRARHFDYFFRMAQQAEPQLFRAESSIDWAEAEIDNIRAALTWALERDASGASPEERTGRGLDVILHVWPLWLNRGYSIEGNEWLNQFLSVHTAKTPARARALLLAGDFARFRGDALGKMILIQEALALAKELGDKKRIAWALMEMGLVERDRHSPEATDFLSESLVMFQELNEALWVCRTSFLLAEAFTESGDLQAARQFWRQGLDLCRAENDQWQMGWGLQGLGDLERLEGHFDQALQLYRESLQLRVSVRDKLGTTYALASFAQLAATQGQFRHAAILWGAAEKLGETLNLFLFTARDQLHTSQIPATRAGLGEEAFRSAWAEGRALKMQEAIDYALAQ
jgi:non-specific serine/threonine protein kinase